MSPVRSIRLLNACNHLEFTRGQPDVEVFSDEVYRTAVVEVLTENGLYYLDRSGESADYFENIELDKEKNSTRICLKRQGVPFRGNVSEI